MGSVTASVYLKLFMKKLPNKLVILRGASRNYLGGLVQWNRLIGRSVWVSVQL